MIQQLEKERMESKQFLKYSKERIEKAIQQIDHKLDRLTAAYLDAGAFSAADFRKKKEQVLGDKRKLLDNLAALEREDVLRFEPIIRFINRSKQGKYVAAKANPRELRKELENIGSNLTVRDRTLRFEPRGAWQLVVDHGSFAQRNAAPQICGAAFVGETHPITTKWSTGESNLCPFDFAYPAGYPAVGIPTHFV
jgi:hypothetical protein